MKLGSRCRETVITCSKKKDNIKTVTTIYHRGGECLRQLLYVNDLYVSKKVYKIVFH